MKAVKVERAKKNEIDWINTKYDEVHFVKSNYENEYIVIARVDNKNAGIGRLVKIDESNVELGGIYVLPNFRGLGVAKSIVLSLCQNNPFDESAFVWCLPFENLLTFYTQFGFKKCLNSNLPKEVEQKLDWCNSDNRYEKKVLLLFKKNKKEMD